MNLFYSINGQGTAESPKVSFFDQSFLRGDGVFEVVRILNGGKLRAIQLHLDRLESSAKQISCPFPSRSAIQQWLQEAAEAGGEGSVRLLATKGDPSEHQRRRHRCKTFSRMSKKVATRSIMFYNMRKRCLL